MNGQQFVSKLEKLKGYKIIFTPHAELRLGQRQIDRKTVLGHLRRPDSLKLVEKLAVAKGEKYKLWFVPFKRIAYIYVIVLNHSQKRIIIKTAIKQRLVWQKKVEKHAR